MSARRPQTRGTVTLERTFDASIEEVWELWTTKEGIESWWGPEGYTVTVRGIDLRPGGELLYAMTAIAPEQIDFMKKTSMPLTTETRLRYTEIVPPRRLAYTNVVDFVPGVPPYDAATTVELERTAGGVRMVLTLEAMHEDRWTQLAVMGWQQELDKLGRLLRDRGISRPTT